MVDIALWTAAVLLMAIGVAGTVLPALPGPVLVFAGVLLIAWADDFNRIGAGTLVAAGVLTGAAHLADLGLSILGVRRSGASRRAVIGASLGALAGLAFGLPGLIVGPFVGAVAAELTVGRGIRGAGRAGLGAWLGFLVGTVVKVALVIAIIAIAAAAFFL